MPGASPFLKLQYFDEKIKEIKKKVSSENIYIV